LINTSSCNAYQKPKLPIFSGEEKSETSFDVWKMEVKCVLREGNYTGLICQLCSQLSHVQIKTTKGFEPFPLKTLLLPVKLMNLCNYPHVNNVYSSEVLLENFFKETQQPNQSS
jgi:hypothetical protein